MYQNIFFFFSIGDKHAVFDMTYFKVEVDGMFEQQTQLKEMGLSLVLRANVIVLPREGFIRSLAPESSAACFPRVLCFRFSERHNLCSVLAVFAWVSLSICHFSVALNKQLNPLNNRKHPFIGSSVWTYASADRYAHTRIHSQIRKGHAHKHRRS